MSRRNSRMLTIDDLHYNSRGVPQVAVEEQFESLRKAMSAIREKLSKGTKLEQSMLAFFEENARAVLAYRDNDVNQGSDGPKRTYVVGRPNGELAERGLFFRLGFSPELIPGLEATYLTERTCQMPVGGGKTERMPVDSDKWVYKFTDRYQGKVEGMVVTTEKGINSVGLIPIINRMILDRGTEGSPKRR